MTQISMREWKNDYHSALKDLEIGFVSLKINHWGEYGFQNPGLGNLYTCHAGIIFEMSYLSKFLSEKFQIFGYNSL